MKIHEQNKIRIKLQAYNHTLLDMSCKTIIDTAHRTKVQAKGPITLPAKRKIYCILRSPHVDKDSREHFEIRSYKKIIDIYEPSSQTIDSLMKLNIPSGVDIEIKL
uniref:Small ribosomal subunit protein uS10c n=1 Tax=Gracilaria tenuistipitata var. liui TaxID=285951 RepID=RR10_GRATL|nr:ribosomal protein S10 [Gracilaria tenuistipitata var. liui]Q6B8Y1.1 RecName: Full=Small ribosomal subunit protein uS10c; AltName: Full=30S ribosomal protein S10, chloroplastic [Gracilaria tenuistipitata var. liui]AAT79654.1 30S ribosomal protein S10 [Gracilaria tenuistipitata var. liui]